MSERTKIDFNSILRNISGETYNSMGGAPLRLGKVVVDAIEAASGARGTPLESDEKLRLADLARKIINTDLEGDITEAPYNTLILPKRVIDKLDQYVGQAAYVTGVYAAANKLLYGDEAKELAFDDVEVVKA